MRRIFLDTETFWCSATYSITNMTNEEYCRDPRWTLMLVTWVVEGENEVQHWDPATSSIEELKRRLDPENTECICHNTNFDGLGLAHNHNIIFKRYGDTGAMARWGLGGWRAPKRKFYSIQELADMYGIEGKLQGGAALSDANGMHRHEMTAEHWQEYLDYGKQDAVILYEVFKKLVEGPCRQMGPKDWRIMSWTYENYVNPIVELDEEILDAYQEKVHSGRAKLCEILGTDIKTLRSKKKFVALVKQRCGVDIPMKKTKPTETKPEGGYTEQTAKNDPFMVEARADPGLLGLICKAKIACGSNIGPSRAARLAAMSRRGEATIGLNMCGAKQTNRFSGVDSANWQNLPKFFGKDEAGKLMAHPIKQAIVAPAGHSLIEVDASQIENRLNAFGSGQADMMELFRKGGDPYIDLAEKIYQRPIVKSDPERQHGKVGELGLGYRLGQVGFHGTCNFTYHLGMARERTDHIHSIYRRSRTQIVQNWKFMDRVADYLMAGGEPIKLNGFPMIAQARPEYRGIEFVGPNNFIIKYPNMRKQEGKFGPEWIFGPQSTPKKYHGGPATENICQHLAHERVSESIATYLDDGIRIVLNVHDSAVAVVPDDAVKDAKEYLVHRMSQPVEWWPELPLAAEANSGKRFSECK